MTSHSSSLDFRKTPEHPGKIDKELVILGQRIDAAVQLGELGELGEQPGLSAASGLLIWVCGLVQLQIFICKSSLRARVCGGSWVRVGGLLG